MNWITKIEIEHFRSINKLTIKDLSDINVFSGLNDVGKSNVIKALNLFFNGQVDWQSPLDFGRDTNTWHTHYSQKGKVRKQISVKLTFSLPPERYKTHVFWIKRQWNKDYPNQPLETWGEAGTSESKSDRTQALTRFLNRSYFFYVPAVRGRDYFQHLLRQFSEAITDTQDKELKTASDNLSTVIDSRSAGLRRILEEITELKFTFELPQSMLALLEAAGLITEGEIPLQMRGDGIQGLTVPGILEHLSSHPKKFYFWGFEEPENSLEYIKATRLAEDIYEKYSKKAQIFLSTHSPAFLAMQNNKTTIYRVFQKSEVYQKDKHTEYVTDIKPVFVRGEDRQGRLLPEELGFFDVVRKIDQEYKEFENQKDEIKSLKKEIQQLTEPILIVEGKHDLATLKHAWGRLYTKSMPFEIIAAGGVSQIANLIRFNVNERHFALYDRDGEGTDDIQEKLPQKGFHKRDEGQYMFGDQILAITLPVPEIPEREAQAENQNLTLEFYFSDSVLMKIDGKLGGKLFSPTEYISKGRKLLVDEEDLTDWLESGKKTMAHRRITKSGKKELVKSLPDLADEDFRAFHNLFSTIVGHLAPDFNLTSSKQEVQQLLTPAAKDQNQRQAAEKPGCEPDAPRAL